MESTVNQYLGELLKQFSGSINSIGDFAREQIPDVIRQFVLYHLVYDAIIVTVSVVGVYMAYRFVKRVSGAARAKANAAEEAYRNGDKWTRFHGEGNTTSCAYDRDVALGFYTGFVLYIVLTVCSLFALVNALFVGVELLKIAIAPKIWLIEQAVAMGRTVTGH